MSVRIQFDGKHSFYTNLDFLSGRIILSLTNEETISAINVKLEGESNTLLSRPLQPQTRRDNRPPILMERHKILYKKIQVFPNNPSQLGLSYTLRAGTHEYPFRIKIPLNNGCAHPEQQQMGPGSGFAGLGFAGYQQTLYRHVTNTLPPSLTGFPNMAEIRYYVKVTVERPSIFRENRRSAIGIKFLPIEPPRPAPSNAEAFAKRSFEFKAGLAAIPKKGSMFKKAPTPLSNQAPKGEIDARLPNPPILTCNEPLPLRVIVRKTNQSQENVFLVSLQAILHGFTEVRAQDMVRTEVGRWQLLSLTGLSKAIGSPSDPIGKEIIIDPSIWSQISLPNTVAPSFKTCNLSRRYELEVNVGLGYGVIGEIQPQIQSLPLCFQVEVYSGIKPPTALIQAMASQPHPPPIPVRPTGIPTPAAAAAPDPLYPPQLGTPAAAAADEAPPSYEEALAEGVTQADDGQRREYSGVTDVDAPNMDDGKAAPRYSSIFRGNEWRGGRGGGGGRGSVV